MLGLELNPEGRQSLEGGGGRVGVCGILDIFVSESGRVTCIGKGTDFGQYCSRIISLPHLEKSS